MIGDYLLTAEHFAKNFFDSVEALISGDLVKLSSPSRGNVKCACRLPLSDHEVLLRTPSGTPVRGLLDLPLGTDVVAPIWSALRQILPAWYQFADDAPPVRRSDLGDDWVQTGDYKSLDLPDDYARDVKRQHRGGTAPYVAAFRGNDARDYIEVQVGFLRAVSFWGCSRGDSPLIWEHDGDGERAYVYVQAVPTRSADGWMYGRLRVVGILGTSHGSTFPYTWEHLAVDASGRARITCARGSHPTSVMSGPTAIFGWSHGIASDTFPTPGEPGVVRSSNFQVPTIHVELEHLYEGSEKKWRWGKNKMLGTKTYEVWSWGPYKHSRGEDEPGYRGVEEHIHDALPTGGVCEVCGGELNVQETMPNAELLQSWHAQAVNIRPAHMEGERVVVPKNRDGLFDVLIAPSMT